MTKILVIDDEIDLLQEIVEWLTYEGYDVAGAVNGIEGVRTAFSYQPDLIVCDIMMPHLDGYGVLLEVHASPVTAYTPFIFLSAKTTHEDIRRGMAMGADDYITKPFRRVELLLAIQARLIKKKAQDDEQQQQVDLLQNLLSQEHEQRQLKAKLVAMYSHEFRNPLMAIITSTHLLEDFPEDGNSTRRRTHLERIEASAQQLMYMLDNMLLISQIEASKLTIKLQPVHIGALFQQICEEFQIINSSSHRIIYEGTSDEMVIADARLLRHLAANLISNAVKYSPPGSEVLVSLEKCDEEYRFTIQDHGIGIPPEDVQHLFEPFHRAGNVGSVSGTGLGLVIAKESVELHGGKIIVQSEQNKGTTFTAYLPLAQYSQP